VGNWVSWTRDYAGATQQQVATWVQVGGLRAGCCQQDDSITGGVSRMSAPRVVSAGCQGNNGGAEGCGCCASHAAEDMG
jgi:hypothetical protein